VREHALWCLLLPSFSEYSRPYSDTTATVATRAGRVAV